MKRLWALALGVCLVIPVSALAQSAVTVAATSGLMVAASIRESLTVCNQSASATISICFADNTGSCTAILNTAGQYTISALQCLNWRPGERPPQSAIYAIASAGSTPVTVSSR